MEELKPGLSIIRDIEKVRAEEFERLEDIVFLDNAGATLYAKSHVERYHQDLLGNVYGNPHSKNSSSKHTADLIDQVRQRILNFFNTTSDEYSVIFTSGSTAALRIVADSFIFNGLTDDCRVDPSTNSGQMTNETHNEDGTLIVNGRGTQNSHGKGCFCYLDDNHTSVVGMREIFAGRGAIAACVNVDFVTQCVEGQAADDSTHPSISVMTDEPLSARTVTGKSCVCCFNNLFAYPAQSNFSGYKYPLEWLSAIKQGMLGGPVGFHGNWFTVLDASSLVGTSPLDLGKHKADFISLSFYKIFGFPTGIGALIVRNEAGTFLKKSFFGGGTVAVSISTERFHVNRPSLSERFEDGTLPYLDIIALKHGFDVLVTLTGGMYSLSQHTYSLVHYVYESLNTMEHFNGNKVADIYSDSGYDNMERQGPIVSFNIKRADGSFVGFAEFDKLAQLQNIHVRTGCFCNMGACQKFLKLSAQQIKDNFQAGHSCGDEMDLLNGKPTGAVRVSFGYMNTLHDAQLFLRFVSDCFKETAYSGLSTVLSESNDFEPKNIVLKNIYLYPIKSCAAFEVESWELSVRGFLHDRDWMIIDKNGISLSQKREPKMGLIKPEIDVQQNKLVLNCEGMKTLQVPITDHEEMVDVPLCQTRVCGKRVFCIDCGTEASDWLSELFGYEGCKLIRQRSNRQTQKLDEPSQLSLANQGQFLLICVASVQLLDEQIQIRQGSKIGTQNLVDRFRSNLVLDTTKPYEEDNWSSITIGKETLKSEGPCSRCHMICIDPITGEKSSEPLRTLSQTRGKRIPFGTLFNQNNCSTKHRLSVGDKVSAIQNHTDKKPL